MNWKPQLNGKSTKNKADEYTRKNIFNRKVLVHTMLCNGGVHAYLPDLEK